MIGTAKVGGEPWALAWSSDGGDALRVAVPHGAITRDRSDDDDRRARRDRARRGAARRQAPRPRPAARALRRRQRGRAPSELWVAARAARHRHGAAGARLRVDGVRRAVAPRARTARSRERCRSTRRTFPASTARSPTSSRGRTRSPSRATARYALMVDTNSEDVLVVDAVHADRGVARAAAARAQARGHRALARRDTRVRRRAQHRATSRSCDRSRAASRRSTSPSTARPSRRSSRDPMPASLRLGQHLFYSANSDEYPITKNHWVACATCHMEGRSDAVTWRFEQGPRDTPTNAGGMLGTGLSVPHRRSQPGPGLLAHDQRRAGRHVRPERSDRSTRSSIAIAEYVNFGIPMPIPPTTDADARREGEGDLREPAAATAATAGRASPTRAPATRRSISRAPSCSTTSARASPAGRSPTWRTTTSTVTPRDACMFDTPSLSGVASTPPYFHDGSAPTLADAATTMLVTTGHDPLAKEDLDALVEYLRSL